MKFGNISQVLFFENIKTKNALVAVPELSVALMGLLGLGMLIQRRRAESAHHQQQRKTVGETRRSSVWFCRFVKPVRASDGGKRGIRDGPRTTAL